MKTYVHSFCSIKQKINNMLFIKGNHSAKPPPPRRFFNSVDNGKKSLWKTHLPQQNVITIISKMQLNKFTEDQDYFLLLIVCTALSKKHRLHYNPNLPEATIKQVRNSMGSCCVYWLHHTSRHTSFMSVFVTPYSSQGSQIVILLNKNSAMLKLSATTITSIVHH
jgi:hypothetical protein